MRDFLKSRTHAYLHSKNLPVCLISLGIWFVANFVNVVILRGNGMKMSLAYALWAFTEFYLCYIPVIVSTWYGNTSTSGFNRNIPYQVKDPSYFASAIVFTLILNTIGITLSLIGGFLIYLIPNDTVVLVNDPSMMLQTVHLLILCSFCRTVFVIFVTELTGSRIWGCVLGMLGSCGFLADTTMSMELIVLKLLGIRETTLPVCSLTNFLVFNNMMPVFDMETTDYIATSLGCNVMTATCRMLIYIALFMSLTIAVNRRKDIL